MAVEEDSRGPFPALAKWLRDRVSCWAWSSTDNREAPESSSSHTLQHNCPGVQRECHYNGLFARALGSRSDLHACQACAVPHCATSTALIVLLDGTGWSWLPGLPSLPPERWDYKCGRRAAERFCQSEYCINPKFSLRHVRACNKHCQILYQQNWNASPFRIISR